MSHWDRAVDTTDDVARQEDFEAAASRLVSEQVLYAADRGSKVAYGLIQQFERDFRSALDPLGYTLRVNSQLRYACAIPRHPKISAVSVDQTLLALVLRKIFDEETRSGTHDENGEVACDLVSLQTKYHQATGGRELASGGKLSSLLQWMRRWGIARISDEDSGPFSTDRLQPFVVIIRPGIADVLGETALQRLAQFSDPALEQDVGDDEAEAALPLDAEDPDRGNQE